MKTLIVHPQDASTIFLSPIYAPIKNKTVIEGVSKSELRKLIEKHDRILMLGHGLPGGLLNTDSFDNVGLFVIDETMVDSLRGKKDNLYIWCHASQFVMKHGLSGLCSAMFISDLMESRTYGFNKVDWNIVNQSNYGFLG